MNQSEKLKAGGFETVLELIDPTAEILVLEVHVVSPMTYGLGVSVAAARKERIG